MQSLQARHLSPLLVSSNRQPRSLTRRAGDVRTRAQLEALVLDCDGVIVESEDLHRTAYNRCFEHFNVTVDGSSVVDWDPDFYDEFQNKVGGGKPKMRWYFNKHGWPTTTSYPKAPETEIDREAMIDELQTWKTEDYQRLMGSGDVEPRPGVLRFIQEAREKGLKVAVCSAATKESVIYTLENLLGPQVFDQLDCFLAGDDVPDKKPNPMIYIEASERLQVAPNQCLVVEDSAIGLEAASRAGMRCIVTYTSSSKNQNFASAERVVPNLEEPFALTIEELMHPVPVS